MTRGPQMVYPPKVGKRVRQERDRAKSAALQKLKDLFPAEYRELYRKECLRRGIADEQVQHLKIDRKILYKEKA